MALLNLPKTGPDSWQGIRVALKCMCVMALTAGGVRSTGVFYVGIMNHFGATREEAAWPVSISGAMLSLIGTVAGPLAQAFSPKPVILCGSLLACIGLLASVFAPNIAWLTLTFGVIFGSGLGTVYTINVIFLQQYFVKMRGLALGINYAGSTTAGFIFPVFISYLLGEYGFRGAVLIMSGVLLHIFALCLTHREAPWLKKGRNGPNKGGNNVDADKQLESVQTTTSTVTSDDKLSFEKPETDLKTAGNELKNPAETLDADAETANELRERKTSKADAKTSPQRVSLRTSLSILKIPEFVVIIFSFSLFLYAYDAYFTTIIDFVADQDIPLIKATTIIPLYSITDMLARLTIPQLGDRGYINKMLLQSLAYGAQTSCYFLLPIAAGTGEFFWIATVAMIHSVGVGTSIVMYGVLMAELIGISRLPMAYGINGLFVGLTYFTKPYFVGHFRDTIGSYSQMYVACGVLTSVSSLCWLVTWYVHRVTKRGRTFSNVSKKNSHANQTDPAPRVIVESVLEADHNEEDAVSVGQRSRADSAVLHL